MSFKEKVESYIALQKLEGGRVSAMAFIRNNFDEITKLISEMKNQGNGYAYKKIAELLFEENVKTKDGRMLSISYINDCLVQIRKEKGIRVRSSVRKKTATQSRESLSKAYETEEIYNIGLNEIKKFYKKCVDEFSKPERGGRKINFTDEQKRMLFLYAKLNKLNNKLKTIISLANDDDKDSVFVREYNFIQAHKEILGLSDV